MRKVKADRISFEDLYSVENLYHAWHKVSLGKSAKNSVLEFYQNLDANLADIAQDLRSETYKPGPYNRFLIKDPKERIISAASVKDRVVHHALMNLFDPLFDKYQIFDSYACRRNKGTEKAVLRAFHFAKSSGYFLKMDVRKYFDSIDHQLLKVLLRILVKGRCFFRLFESIIDSNHPDTGKGLPIGNLTSQYFANHYLAGFDHFMKEKQRLHKYIRYMDDILLFADDKSNLKALYALAVSYTGEKLDLTLKPAIISSVKEGAPFLGFLIKDRGIYLQRKSKNRYKIRLKEIEHELERGSISESEAGKKMESVTSHLLLARSRTFRNTLLRGRVLGYEPR